MASHTKQQPELVTAPAPVDSELDPHVGAVWARRLIGGLTIGMALLVGAFLVLPTTMMYVIAGCFLLAWLGGIAGLFSSFEIRGYGYDGEEYRPQWRPFFRRRQQEEEVACFVSGEIVTTPPARELAGEFTVDDTPVLDYFLGLHLRGDWDSHASVLTNWERVRNHKAVVTGKGPVVSRFGRKDQLVWITTRADRSRTTISTTPPDPGEGHEWD